MKTINDSISKVKLNSTKLRQAGIGIIYLFGSYAEGVSDPQSDLDVGIVFTNSNIIKLNTFPAYDKIYRLLCDAFPHYQGKLDIVFLQRAPLELQFDVVKYGKVLYKISTDFRLNYEEYIGKLYADFYPILCEMDDAILKRI